jgi:phosphoglycolate phosphatase
MTKKLLVCDLDNTLYDWVGYFVSAFYAMVDELVTMTNFDRERLLDDFREVHRYHNDSEHPFALLETKAMQDLFLNEGRGEMARKLDRVFHAFNKKRKEKLQLYPGVREGLDALTDAKVMLVAHTESKLFAVVDRLRRLDLERYFGRIYCRERPNSLHPDPELGRQWLQDFPMEKVVELSQHQRKPNPDVLLEICRSEGTAPADAAYIGDSIARDVLMARRAGVFAIWAKYGGGHSSEEYAQLVRISHWTREDIEREASLRREAEGLQADAVLERSFFGILEALELKVEESNKRIADGG